MFGAVLTHSGGLDLLRTGSNAQVVPGENRVGTERTAIHFAADSAVAVDGQVRFTVEHEVYFSAGTACLIIISHDPFLSKTRIHSIFIIAEVSTAVMLTEAAG
jgi:hypothetical protein